MPPDDESAVGSNTDAAAAAAAAPDAATVTSAASASAKPKSKSSHNHDGEARVPFLAWFLVGGTGQPPKKSNFLRMAHERNEAGRRAAERKEALAERSRYLADWEKRWGKTGGGGGLLSKVYGSGGSQSKK